MIAGVEPGAQDNGPDVDEVFAEEGETPHLHNGKAVEGVAGELDEADGEHGHKPRVYQGRAGAADGHIVRNQQVLHGDDVVQPLQNVHGGLQRKSQEHQPRGEGQCGRE